MENYIELYDIRVKMKRLLIPVIGNGLNYLFGTARESDLSTICSSFSRLAMNQQEIVHVVDENISVINITRVECQKIDKL